MKKLDSAVDKPHTRHSRVTLLCPAEPAGTLLLYEIPGPHLRIGRSTTLFHRLRIKTIVGRKPGSGQPKQTVRGVVPDDEQPLFRRSKRRLKTRRGGAWRPVGDVGRAIQQSQAEERRQRRLATATGGDLP